MFTIIVTEKGGKKQRLEFDEETVSIGRVQGNHVVLPRGNVSKRHARIEQREGKLFLVDLGSTNGTYVNGRRLTGPTRITPGDKIYMGEFILGVEEAAAAPPAEAVDAPAPPAPRLTEPKRPVMPRPSRAAPPPRAARPTVPRPADPKDRTTEQPLPDLEDEPPTTTHARPTSEDFPLADPRVKLVPARGAARPPAGSGLGAAVEPLVRAVAEQIKRVDPAKTPAIFDEGTAARIRLVLQDVVKEQAARGRLTAGIDTGALISAAFRAIVDLGSLGAWLEDPSVAEIRLLGHGTARLLVGGAWSDAAAAWASPEALGETLRCLAAGLATREEDGSPGLHRYRLEDGTLVLADLSPASPSGPSAVIFKHLGLEVGSASRGYLVPGSHAHAVVVEAIAARGRIAVVGPSLAPRLSLFAEIVRLLPEDELVVGVQDVPLVGFAGGRRLGIAGYGLASRQQDSGRGRVGALLERAVDRNPEWFAVCGTALRDIAPVLAVCTGRRGAVTELPLAGGRSLDRELAAALLMSGTAAELPLAGELLAAAFDLVVVADRGRSGAPEVVRLLGCTRAMRSGSFQPEELFERDG
jgi:pilus assembly protein CpaF